MTNSPLRADIAGDGALTLSSALLVYESGERAVCTAHPVRIQGGRAEIGPGKLAEADDLCRLARALVGAAVGCAWIDQRVLATGAERTVWWSPPARRPMFLAGEAAHRLPGLSGVPLPHPGLVFAADSRGLRVYARRTDDAPRPDAPLAHAPYPNLFRDGRLCAGSAPLPPGHDAPSIDAWEKLWWDSAFTHLGAGALGAEGADLWTVWREAAAADAFPVERLRPNGLTVGDLVEGAREPWR